MADVQAQVTGTAGTLALAFLALLAFLGQGGSMPPCGMKPR